jgi:hypothetical protein
MTESNHLPQLLQGSCGTRVRRGLTRNLLYLKLPGARCGVHAVYALTAVR